MIAENLNNIENNNNNENEMYIDPIANCNLREKDITNIENEVSNLATSVRPYLPWECGLVLALIPPMVGIARYVRRLFHKKKQSAPMTLLNPVFQPQMMNVDDAFAAKSTSDYRVDAEKVSSEVAKIETRDIVNVESVANKYMLQNYFDDVYRIDAKPYVERPFYVGSVQVNDTLPRFSILTTTVQYLPGDVIRSNVSLLNAMKIASLYRSNLTLNISAAGTIGHAGCVLVGVIPPRATYPVTGQLLINTLLSGPHGFLNFNEATVLNLEVPWYCNTDYASLDMDNTNGYVPSADFTLVNGNYAMLVMVLLNPLSVADGSSKTLDIVIEACFKALDMYVPTPRYITWEAQMDMFAGIGTKLLDMTAGGLKKVATDAVDTVRKGIKSETGLHNPNVPYLNNKIVVTDRNYYNIVNAGQFFEKLHPFVGERVVQEPIFGCDVDEMNLAHVGAKKQMLGTFQVTTSDGVGTLKWVRPISPFQGGSGPYSTNGVKITNNIELLHSLHMGWRGKINIHIQSVMNNKQQVKLKLIKYYNPSLSCLTGYPQYKTIVSAPSHLMEFTQGGQEHVVELPYLCRNAITPCAEDMSLEGLLHGLYYIYVAQSLVNADGSPVSCEFNVYISLDSQFQWYGYSTKTMYPLNYDTTTPPIEPQPRFSPNVKLGMTTDMKKLTKAEFYKKYVKNQKQFEKFNKHIQDLRMDAGMGSILNVVTNGSIWKSEMRVMNEPQVQTSDMTQESHNLNNSTRLLPNEDIRPTIRRMYRSIAETVQVPALGGQNASFTLASIIGNDNFNPIISPVNIASRMYYGKSVGFKITIRFTSQGKNLDDINVKIHYITPNMVITSTNQLVRSSLANPNAYPDVFTPGVVDPPVPLQFLPVSKSANNAVYEFVVPNTTYVKFVGSPDQFLNLGVVSNSLATSDCGSICITISNTSDQVNDLNVEFLVGLTDESRLGFHTIAPPFYVDKNQSTYLGNTDGNNLPISNVVNKYLYKGGFGGL